MTTPTCPKCRATIPSGDVNVAADVAFCRNCNLSHSLSTIGRGTGIDPTVDLTRPPKGVWHRPSGLGTTVGASHRSFGGAAVLLGFATFWNGIVSVFVALALSSTISLIGLKPPVWFPNPVMNGGVMGVGVTVFLWLFLTPFILIGLAMMGGVLLCLGGRTEVYIRDWQGEIFTGIGPIGRRRKFKTETVKDVRIEDKQWRDSDGDRRRSTEILVEMTDGKPLKFGSSLAEDRRQFMAAALRKSLIK
jgi:hypothetical protein